MTSTVVRWGVNTEGEHPGKLKEIIFSCDAKGCDTVADDKEIVKSGGLRFMGWWAAGGTHYCPKHFDQGGEVQW